MRIVKKWFAKRSDFYCVVYTDETRFFIDDLDHLITWQLKKNFNNQNRCKRPFDGGWGWVLVHGSLLRTEELLVIKVKWVINSQKQIMLLKEDVVPFIETNYNKNWVFKEDNARTNTSKNTKKV